MNNIVILNGLDLSGYAYKELYDGRSAVDYAVEIAGKLPDCRKTAVLLRNGADGKFFQGMETVVTETTTLSGLVEILSGLSAGYDNIFYYYADCPLVDPGLSSKMYANHRRYFCEYTFADGYPAGVSVEIINPSIMQMLAGLAEGDDRPPARNSLFSLIEKDINAFELETEISPDDQRLLRLALYPDTRRNYLQLRDLFKAVKESGHADGGVNTILETVRARGEFLRTLPAFYEFETTSVHPQTIDYMPSGGGLSNAGGVEMSVEDFSTAVSRAAEFSGDAVISLSVRNEPSAHSEPARLAEAVLSHDGLRLLIETSGLGWDQQQLQRILDMAAGRITWIIDLDALDPGLYKQIRGQGRDEAYAFALKMIELSPENVWVQTVRTRENEEDNEDFYKYWKEKTNNVIIQKYDWCCGRLEQRKITDLSPLKRLPCWHLKREMVVLVDGSVPVCRDDLEHEFICGNIFNDEIGLIWKNGDELYRRHLDEEYPGLCRNCDEYYTYNY